VQTESSCWRLTSANWARSRSIREAAWRPGNDELSTVWIYRWWEPTANGRKKRRGLTVGTVEKYKTEAEALKAAEGMRLMANDGIFARERVHFCGILDRFLIEQKQEQEAEQITYQTLS